MIHFPLVIHLGFLTIPAHRLFEFLAYVLGFQFFLYLRGKSKDFLSEQQRLYLLTGAAVGALICSKILGLLSTVWGDSSPSVILKIVWSGKSVVGGILGAVIGVEVVKKLLKINLPTGDLFTSPLILAMMIGRMGCFFAGVYDGTHGIPSHLPWAMDMGDGILRHPTQLYEIIFLGIFWFMLWRLEGNLRTGFKFKIFVVGYLFYRFFSEFIKPMPILGFGLTAIQMVCLAGCIYYYRVWMFPQEAFIFRKEKEYA